MPRAWLTCAVSRVDGWRLVVTRSLKHMAKSRKTPAVSSSSRAPLAAVITSSVARTTARSAGKSRRAARPIARASPSRAGRGSHPIAAARR